MLSNKITFLCESSVRHGVSLALTGAMWTASHNLYNHSKTNYESITICCYKSAGSENNDMWHKMTSQVNKVLCHE